MNAIINKVLLAGHKLMSEMHLKPLMNHLQKNKERIQKFKETEDSQYIC